MRSTLLAIVLALTACQMYGAAPDPLSHVTARAAPPVPTTQVADVHYVDDCATDFHRNPHAIRPQPQLADPLVASGEATEASAVAATGRAQADLLVRAIQHYADALRADPYNASATLKLAVAYDHVLRRGCALAMLRRLASLAQNPTIAPGARDRVADVVDNPQWFKGYRKDALAAANP